MLRIFLLVAAMAVVARCGEVTKMLETLDGYDHFSGIRVYVDDCAEGKPVNKDDDTPDVCNLEGFEYPCCHVVKGTEVKGHMTMISEEDTLDNGLITCRVGVGAQLAETCIEPEFCKGLNTTCPVSGPTPVSYDFSFATDNWGRTHIGSRPETLVLQQSEGVNMLKFTMNFRVFDN